jgi:P-type Cu+ transporter
MDAVGSAAGDSALGRREVELVIGGMTCASCPPRIERKLTKLAGVTATVNFATERAKVTFPPELSTEDLVRVVRDTGYTATPVMPRIIPEPGAEQAPEEDTGLRALRDHMRGSVALAMPVIVLAMVPPLQFTNWQWLSLTLAAPVVVWGAWPFHKAHGPTPGTASPPWTP